MFGHKRFVPYVTPDVLFLKEDIMQLVISTQKKFVTIWFCMFVLFQDLEAHIST